MSTTRHHLNRQRRLSAVRTEGTEPDEGAAARPARRAVSVGPRLRPVSPQPGTGAASEPTGQPEPEPENAPEGEKGTEPRARGPQDRGRALIVALVALTLFLGAFAGLGFSRSAALDDEPARRNTALTDTARTSEVRGRVAEAVGALFSYDYADEKKLQKAASTLLTGKAVGVHRELLADVRAQGQKQKLVLTTTVTDSAVERIEGDRARVLVYADQSSASTAAKTTKKGKAAQDQPAYAGAVFTVDLLHRDGRWLVSGIDTFGG